VTKHGLENEERDENSGGTTVSEGDKGVNKPLPILMVNIETELSSLFAV
jgi:hypothetical protein